MTTPPTPHPEQALQAFLSDLDMFLANCPRGMFEIQAPDGDIINVHADVLRALAALRPQAAQPCDMCGGAGELFIHADDCDGDLCALNGDVHSCVGQVVRCDECQPHSLQPAQAAPDDDDDDDLLTIAFMSGVERGKEMAQAAPAEQPEAAEPVAAPVQPVATPDLGPWTASADGRRIDSDDFEHDAALLVRGDFGSDAERSAYAVDIARRLSATPPVSVEARWINGEPANLAAAAMDASEWLALIERLHLAGRWKFSEADSLDKLRGCRAALDAALAQQGDRGEQR